ncbi:hypothetical protein [Pseudosporangium ferrugineum]|uniref:Uncharacterized protein n=1 Tax=Pseudosporangium ferrugineum TaxID=439699 RepID=A0A2T0RSD0_9ACTN|nr:hypothetical protein [Pseudosporangium ferrugineum]PRY24027.1 hypothetical protein CLV70_114160 [Pseudosporangium ferrugineum]
MTSLATTTPGTMTTPAAGSTAGTLVAPDGPGAAGVAAVSLTRQYLLLDKAHQALTILFDVGADLTREAITNEDLMGYLTASFGERYSQEQIRTIAGMLTQIAEGSLNLVAQARDACQAGATANLHVQAIAEQLHATGADGAYVDAQRRAG